MRQGDLYWVDLQPTLGHEQQGRRPVLILSVSAFNRVAGMAMVAPVTTGGGFARRAGFAVSLEGYGLETKGVVRCDQIRTLDVIARHGRFIEATPLAVVDDVIARVMAFLGIEGEG